jgi:hypothetical protein
VTDLSPRAEFNSFRLAGCRIERRYGIPAKRSGSTNRANPYYSCLKRGASLWWSTLFIWTYNKRPPDLLGKSPVRPWIGYHHILTSRRSACLLRLTGLAIFFPGRIALFSTAVGKTAGGTAPVWVAGPAFPVDQSPPGFVLQPGRNFTTLNSMPVARNCRNAAVPAANAWMPANGCIDLIAPLTPAGACPSSQ